MKKILLLLISIGFWQIALCQPDNIMINKEEIFLVVEQQPTFPGGMNNFYQYLAKNLIYPKQAQEKGTQGRVIAQFVVKIQGNLSDIKIIKGIGDGCDEEVVRVLKTSPLWKPGMQKGKPVNVRISLPVMFKIAEPLLSKNDSLQLDIDTLDVHEIKKIASIEQPSFGKEGVKDFYKYIGYSLKYPTQARRNNTQGKVFAQFVVRKDGRLSNIKILKGIGDGCDEEVIRVLRNSPRWKPGKDKGQPVNVRMSLPIIFKLTH